MRTVVYLTVALVISSSGFLARGQDGDVKGSLQERLNSHFALTQITSDRSDIVSAGATLVLQKGGLMMYSTASPLPPVNTYKNGKLSQGGSGFGRDLLITMATPGSSTATNYPHRQFVEGEKLWVIGVGVQKDGVVFRLYSEPYDGVRYYGQLKFQFEKGSAPTPDQAMAKVAEVLTVQQAGDAVQQPAATQVGQVAGQYVMAQATDNRLQLNADGTLFLVQGGRSVSGTYTIEGNRLTLRIGRRRAQQTATLDGDTMTDHSGSKWVKQTVAGGQADGEVVATKSVSLRLPSMYVSAQSETDQLQLNADNTFTLQEAGQTYGGTFAANGATVELNISGGSKSTATIQGDNLTDSSGQTWLLRKQPLKGASSSDVLQNQDIVKMVKASFDDATIVAKIGSSKCHFDTSTDALIQLKQSGVSAAVIKAIIGAGN
jgi:hypothetical protein